MEKSSSIKDVERIINFDDNKFCFEMEQMCPIISAAIKGALGLGLNSDDSKAIGTGIYGAIFK